MRLGTFRPAISERIADCLAQSLQPQPGPGELDPQYCQSYRDDDQCRPGSDDHDDADCNNRTAQDGNRDAARCLVSQMNCFLDHA